MAIVVVDQQQTLLFDNGYLPYLSILFRFDVPGLLPQDKFSWINLYLLINYLNSPTGHYYSMKKTMPYDDEEDDGVDDDGRILLVDIASLNDKMKW